MLSRNLIRCMLPVGVALSIGSAAAAPAPAVDLVGYYAVPDYSMVLNVRTGPMVVAVYSCGAGNFCGKIAARGPLSEKDLANPVEASRSRALCGLDILSVSITSATAKNQAGATLQGKFYDPRTGDDSAVQVHAGPKGELHVFGHAGRPIVSRTYVRPEEVWQRVAPLTASCEQAQPAT